MIPIPPGPFSLIYADPPWQYRDKCNSGKRGAEFKYRCMDYIQIGRLPIEQIAAKDCLLAMWWVGPMPEEALCVMKSWGFRLVNMKGFSWRKLTKHGKEHFGMGNWSRANTEDCLFAVRGKPKRMSASVRQVINSTLRGHSQKPDEARERLVHLCGDVPRIELFARHRFPGWEAWGDEVPS